MVTRRGWYALLFLLVLMQGCPDPSDWDPAGNVRWLQWREVDTAGTRVAQGTFALKNTGRVALTSVELALELTTDRDHYYTQFHAALDLPPGMTSFQTVEWQYRDATETSSLAGVRVESASFR